VEAVVMVAVASTVAVLKLNQEHLTPEVVVAVVAQVLEET
jgi:hypothetical protein